MAHEKHRYRLTMAMLSASLAVLAIDASAAEPPRIEFNRDVRPILSDHCFQCHGPDAKNRQADLRLDVADEALASRDAKAAVVPGKLAESELWRRITAADPDERMPPPEGPRKLSDQQIATLGHWIEQGAQWEPHWSFVPPKSPDVPAVDAAEHVLNSIDALVVARLRKEGMTSSPSADPATLLRRVTLDLTGLPPTPGEASAFQNDSRPDAYERVVDRLLASPRYGERMAVRWLDAARYADTSGYQSDGERVMWRWRDWVIDALNANMPFDQFTIEQLAGDLLPQPTLDQRLATGFNRNHRGNAEGGIIPEEYAVEYVVDRVETTSTVWLGLTLGCARCHDHKFDPFTQKEFYELYAFFNNVPEKGRAIKIGNSPPFILTPTRLQAEQLTRHERRQERAVAEWAAIVSQLNDPQDAWEGRAVVAELADWQPAFDLVAAFSLDGVLACGKSGAESKIVGESPKFDAGAVGEAMQLQGNGLLEVGDIANFGFFDKFTLTAWVKIPPGGGGTILSRMADVPQGDGYQLALVSGKLQLNLSKRWLDDAIRVETATAIEPGKWHHVAAAYDGSRVADGIRLYIDGQPQQIVVLLDELNQTFASKEPLRIGGGGGPEMRFRGMIDEPRVYAYDLPPEDMTTLATKESIGEIVRLPRRQRTTAQRHKLQQYFVEEQAAPPIQQAYRELQAATRELRAFKESLPTTMVMEELPVARPTHVLNRGQYDQPGELVEPGVPQALPPLPKELPRNRLGLATWLVDPANPLTARVTVNRYWQMYFGVGLVKTAEDFGAQGDWPVHPGVLDWLATEFIRSGWDVKGIQRAIVTSSTYRQSSRLTPALAQRDPENQLLARGPRIRLSAEMVRDQALFASGLLVEQLGGPSVRPYQPPGLWKELTGGEDYQPGSGAEHYRRSMYTFWKRTIPPPSMATFDAASREFCTIRETRTNTPLQALALLNEETYVEAARALAERVMNAHREKRDRLSLAFQLVTGRQPLADELQVLARAHEAHLSRYEAAPDEAAKLIRVGQSAPRQGMAAIELAAYTAVCSTILNLDEVVTKE